MKYGKLVGRKVVEIDVMEAVVETNVRKLKEILRTRVSTTAWVVTEFRTLSMRGLEDETELWFISIISGGSKNEQCLRCETFEQAFVQHMTLCEIAIDAAIPV